MRLLICSVVLIFSSLAAQASNFESLNIAPAAVDRQYYDFGFVPVNSVRYVNYSVTNTGDTPLTFSRAVIYGGAFSATHSCSGVLAPKAKCGFEIRFWPMLDGVTSGRFILDFVEDSSVIVDLWGTGTR